MSAVLGIVLIVCQQVMFAGETAMVHAMSGTLSIWQIIAMRSFGVLSLSFFLGNGIRSALKSFKTDQWRMFVLRWLCSTGYLFVFAYSFSNLPLADATAISYSQTLYITLFGSLILGEKATATKWLIVSIGFCGSLIVAHPSGGSNAFIYLLIIAGTSLNAMVYVLGRLLQRKDDAATVMFYPSLATLVIFMPIASINPWHPSWLWTGLLVLGPIGVVAGTFAVRYADVAILAPWLYTRLIIAAFVGIVVMHETPDQWTLLGLTMILVSCLMTFIFTGDSRGRRAAGHRAA